MVTAESASQVAETQQSRFEDGDSSAPTTVRGFWDNDWDKCREFMEERLEASLDNTRLARPMQGKILHDNNDFQPACQRRREMNLMKADDRKPITPNPY
jgi:hypothetical protein